MRTEKSADDPWISDADFEAACVTPVADKERKAAHREFQLGNQQLAHDNLGLAEQHFLRALSLDPSLAEAWANLGAMLKDARRPAQARLLLQRAVRLQPSLPAPAFNLALLLIEQGEWAEAAKTLRQSLALNPNQPDAQYWLGNALMGLGETGGARDAYRAAIRLMPGYVQARWGYAMACLPAVAMTDAEQAAAPQAWQAEIEGLQHWFKSHRAAPGHLAVGAQQPYYLAYVDGNHREVLSRYGHLCSELMQAWSKKAGLGCAMRARSAPCRLGIVSAHVHSHSVWHALLKGWIAHLDKGDFEIHVFHTGTGEDAETAWAERQVHQFHRGPKDWTEWAREISGAELDVLLYPEIGMDATTVRLSAMRLARLQLASWGHPLSTGLPTIDAYLSAAAIEPTDADTHYTEQLIRLPGLGCCYQPFGTKPARLAFSGWGIAPDDVVLLCAGTPQKYAPAHDQVLVEIARRAPTVKLVFVQSTNEGLASLLEKRLRAAFSAAGLCLEEHIRLVPWMSQAEFFALLDRTDLYLDTIGFSGFNTAMQAVERATPIVAFEGPFFRGRFASAILRQMQLDDCVAGTTDQFVETVLDLVADPSRRKNVSAHIKRRRQALMNDQTAVQALAREILSRIATD